MEEVWRPELGGLGRPALLRVLVHTSHVRGAGPRGHGRDASFVSLGSPLASSPPAEALQQLTGLVRRRGDTAPAPSGQSPHTPEGAQGTKGRGCVHATSARMKTVAQSLAGLGKITVTTPTEELTRPSPTRRHV